MNANVGSTYITLNIDWIANNLFCKSRAKWMHIQHSTQVQALLYSVTHRHHYKIAVLFLFSLCYGYGLLLHLKIKLRSNEIFAFHKFWGSLPVIALKSFDLLLCTYVAVLL